MSHAKITVTSEAFADGQAIPARYSSDGQDLSPPLRFTGLPPQTKALALIVDDPDAPAGVWDHWVVYDIPVTDSLAEGLSSFKAGRHPQGMTEGKNSWGSLGYRGPAPPPGKVHHYRFCVYALDAAPDLPAGLDSDALREKIRGHVIAEGVLTGTYRR